MGLNAVLWRMVPDCLGTGMFVAGATMVGVRSTLVLRSEGSVAEHSIR